MSGTQGHWIRQQMCVPLIRCIVLLGYFSFRAAASLKRIPWKTSETSG
jgi:hypothetical protein